MTLPKENPSPPRKWRKWLILCGIVAAILGAVVWAVAWSKTPKITWVGFKREKEGNRAVLSIENRTNSLLLLKGAKLSANDIGFRTESSGKWRETEAAHVADSLLLGAAIQDLLHVTPGDIAAVTVPVPSEPGRFQVRIYMEVFPPEFLVMLSVRGLLPSFIPLDPKLIDVWSEVIPALADK
jgi:hypothetical protein